MKLMKIEALIDANDIVDPQVIASLIDAIFKNNDHLAKLIMCEVTEVKEKKKEHEWRFYINGTFCIKCNQQIGTDRECI